MSRRLDIVRVSRLFNPVGIEGGQRVAHAVRLAQGPLLVGVKHETKLGSGDFSQHAGPAEVAIPIARAHLQLESAEPCRKRGP
jgi:hypothetical protein